MDWSKVTFRKIRGLIVFTILILVGLWKFDIVLDVLGFVWGIILPFVIGGAIAFIINVPMSFLEKKIFGAEKEKRGKVAKKLARPLSLVLTLVLVLGVIVLVMFVLVPQLGETFSSLGQNIAAFIPQFQKWIQDFTNNNQEIMNYVDKIEFNPDKIIQWAMSFLGNGAGNMMNTTVAAVGSIISGVATFFIAFSFACYILIQKEKLHVQVRKVIFAFVPKRKAEVGLEICALTYKTFSSFLTGQCVEAVILGSMFVVSMTVLGLPYALLTGIVIAFTALIPIFGGFIGCGVGTFLIFMVDVRQAVFFVVLFLVLQQIEGNLIYPHVVGGSVGLPSIWVLAAVTIGGNLMGIVGMLIFIPLVSVVYTLFREVVYLELKKQRIKRVTVDSVEEYTEEEVERMQEIFREEQAERLREMTRGAEER
ncbi:AI-2E family transporter [Roseburia hominis]